MQLSPLYETDHPRNPNYEKDIVYVMKYTKWILNPIGIWPAVLKGVGKFLPTIAIGFNNLALLFIVIQCVLHITLEQKDPLLRLKFLGLTCFISISLMKYYALTKQKSNIEYCIKQVQSDWKQVELQKDRKLMLKYGKISRCLTMCSVVLIYSGGLMYISILQYTIGSYVDENNRTIKLLAYPTYNDLYDVRRSPIYEITYAFQCVCGYVFDTIAAGSCGLAALFITHACGQIDIIISRLNDLVVGKFSKHDSNANVRMTEIVKHHIRILRFSQMVGTILQEVCFLEFVGSTFVICLLEYFCIADWKQKNSIGVISYLVLLTSLMFNLFILCYTGNLLLDKSSNIGVLCFMIEWYSLPTKTIQSLVLVIAMSNSPLKITAGRIVDMSLLTFGNIMKTSFAYLNFIQTTIM
ncbi:PREDICTED: odorant receptor 85b-like [Eufriesea mexicana]|uniref:odorant receptor 85b-like n=1 Tax=Eufriesea mexicana TaxID=516756 RepID=UPI00083C3A76|nr:PREDICTED: odorant receptor 85b-like [Eufriesea mexicana]